MKHTGYDVVPFPPVRQLIVDGGRLAHHKHTVRGLFEVDVTQVRTFIRTHKEATGEARSFTAFMIACVGRAVDDNRIVHAYRNLRGQLVLFDDVDVITYIEIDFEGRKFPLAHVLRGVNRRTWREIHDEIRTVQATPEQAPTAGRWKAVRWALFLPAFVRAAVYRLANRSPHLWKKAAGTVYLTAVGMFGHGGGWGIGFSSHTLGITLGGISQKPVVVGGRIEIREILDLTVEFDHDVVDGAPAARFVVQFKALIEGGYPLA